MLHQNLIVRCFVHDKFLAGEAPSIIVSAALAIAVCVLMYLLALGVPGARKINNQAENEPEF
ncbi:MAG: hypothetical protein ACI4QY_06565 [Oscillospiraceae bacterium]